ncbi:hypothetical protein J7K93_00575 [bacterium]|nr:hypothetical protein [bacterium]
MFVTLLLKEIHNGLFSLKFMVALIPCLILIPLGMYIKLKDYQRRLYSYEQSVSIYQQEHPGERSIVRGGKAFRKPSDLSIVSIGPDLILFLLFNILLFAGTYMSFLRYDVR